MSYRDEYNAKQRRLAAPRIAKVKKMREAGKTWAEIGQALGVSRQRAQQLSKQ